MALFFEILGFALFVFWLLLIARVVVEFIRSFSRDWQPKGLTVVVLEVIMTVTDPPVKLLRRLIPQLTIGAVRFDLSIMVLLLVAFTGMQLAFGAADNSARVVSVPDGKEMLKLDNHSDWVLGTAFSRDGKDLVTASRDQAIKMTVVESGFRDLAGPDDEKQRHFDDHRSGWEVELGHLDEYLGQRTRSRVDR